MTQLAGRDGEEVGMVKGSEGMELVSLCHSL